MKRHNYFAQNLGMLPLDIPEVDYSKLPVVSRSDQDNVLDQIYKADPFSGQPVNALGLFLSEDTHPLIRDYISRVLVNPNSDIPVPDGLSDYDLETLVRQRHETLEEYTNKVRSFMEDVKSGTRTLLKKEILKQKEQELNNSK